MQHFEKQISEYTYRTGKTNAEAIASLLDYIISYFDVDVYLGNKERPQDKELYSLMSEYFLCQQRMTRHNNWFDVWGVLFEKFVCQKVEIIGSLFLFVCIYANFTLTS